MTTTQPNPDVAPGEARGAPLDLEQFAGSTPGPWTVGSSDAHDYMGDLPASSLYIADARAGVVCEVDSCGEPLPPSAVADAHLLAAAPALLEECRRQRDELRWLADSEAALIRRRTEQDAEIARLRGALDAITENLCDWETTGEDGFVTLAAEAARAALAASEGEVA